MKKTASLLVAAAALNLPLSHSVASRDTNQDSVFNRIKGVKFKYAKRCGGHAR